jgi:CRISPR-associated exonuclease Cas4
MVSPDSPGIPGIPEFVALIGAVVLLVVALMLILSRKHSRRRHGLTDDRTLDLDGQTLYSPRLGLAGRPDRVIEENGIPIPEEWKKAPRVYPSHRVQVGTYLVLIEEVKRIQRPHGYLVTGDNERHPVKNTDALRSRVLWIAGQIRAMRRNLHKPIPVADY